MTMAPSIERYLREKDVDYKLVTHSRTGSTHESAEAAHVAEDHMAKAVMVRDDRGDAMVVVPGSSWVHIDALNRETGRNFRLDEESDLKALLPDCTPGAVPALGPAYGLETFLDESLATLASVCFEAGDHEHLVHLSGEDFLKLLRGARRGRFTEED